MRDVVSFFDIPYLVVKKIFSFLSIDDIRRIRLTCIHFRFSPLLFHRIRVHLDRVNENNVKHFEKFIQTVDGSNYQLSYYVKPTRLKLMNMLNFATNLTEFIGDFALLDILAKHCRCIKRLCLLLVNGMVINELILLSNFSELSTLSILGNYVKSLIPISVIDFIVLHAPKLDGIEFRYICFIRDRFSTIIERVIRGEILKTIAINAIQISSWSFEAVKTDGFHIMLPSDIKYLQLNRSTNIIGDLKSSSLVKLLISDDNLSLKLGSLHNICLKNLDIYNYTLGNIKCKDLVHLQTVSLFDCLNVMDFLKNLAQGKSNLRKLSLFYSFSSIDPCYENEDILQLLIWFNDLTSLTLYGFNKITPKLIDLLSMTETKLKTVDVKGCRGFRHYNVSYMDNKNVPFQLIVSDYSPLMYQHDFIDSKKPLIPVIGYICR